MHGCGGEARVSVWMLDVFVGQVCAGCWRSLDRMIPSGGPVRSDDPPMQLHITVKPSEPNL